MSDEEMSQVDRGVRLIPATAGIIVLAYNLKELKGDLKLPREVYVGIFSGGIRRWDDPGIKQANPGLNLPGLDIIPVTRADSSGTTFAFTNHLGAVSSTWRDQGPGIGKVVKWPPGSMSARGNEGVAGRIKLTDGAIGYVEYGYAQRAPLAMALVENKAGRFIEPSPAHGQATLTKAQNDMPENRRMFLPDPDGENSYPIVTYSWILLYGSYPDQKKYEVVKDFVRWGITEGQKFSESLGFCSLPTRVRELGIRSPLQEVGLSKAEIRLLAEHFGLDCWDKPASACLASRIPYGSKITRDKLAQVERAEEFIRGLRVARQIRVRHHGDVARIEVEDSALTRLMEEPFRERIVEHLAGLGFRHITLDLGGYRMGSLNRAIEERSDLG
ncbi:MAG: phosphate ABC transporter substrate-binding protein PstS [Syntrophobacteraceae bacterium]|nr:phosphate ABC transporter substrate-binding protein PstS [Syntrophobacteraceae bacterium]